MHTLSCLPAPKRPHTHTREAARAAPTLPRPRLRVGRGLQAGARARGGRLQAWGGGLGFRVRVSGQWEGQARTGVDARLEPLHLRALRRVGLRRRGDLRLLAAPDW
eukprot:scaffold65401_cov39-Phaeocystis_antarctica.AAC.1